MYFVRNLFSRKKRKVNPLFTSLGFKLLLFCLGWCVYSVFALLVGVVILICCFVDSNSSIILYRLPPLRTAWTTCEMPCLPCS